MCTVMEVNSVVYPASQKFPIEIRECRKSHGSMCPACACVGNWSSRSCNSLVSRMVAPLGMPMTIEGAPVFCGLCGTLGCKKCPVATVSATPMSMVVVENR